jgi:hypothetical protein
MTNKSRKSAGAPIGLWLTVCLTLAVIPILAGWVGDVSKNWLKGEDLKAAEYWLFAIGAILLPLLAFVVVRYGRKLVPTRIVEEEEDPEKRRVVIALLSPCENLRHVEGVGWQVTDKDGKAVTLSGLPLDTLVAKDRGLPKWKWQQTLRAAHFHHARMEKLVLIGSLGGSGTEEQLGLAHRYFTDLFPGKVEVWGWPPTGIVGAHTQPVDFENLGKLMAQLRGVISHQLDRAGYSEEDIVIDCTGGYKTTSIAAAMVTLDRPKLAFQYVGTGEHAGRVIAFNAVSEYFGH